MAEAKSIQSVNHALDIIEYLYHVGKESSIREISEGTGMFGSTIHRQLATLKERGYIYQNPTTLKYWLGLRFYAIGNQVKHNLPILGIVGTAAEQLGKKYGLNVFIAVPNYPSDFCALQAIIFRKDFSAMLPRNEVTVGTVLASHGSATGKCMMAYYPDSLIQQYRSTPLVKMTDKTITDWDALIAELATIRTRGYALDAEEEEIGKTCIAVPVLDSFNNIVASLSLSGQTKNIFENPINALVKDLNEVAAMISSKI